MGSEGDLQSLCADTIRGYLDDNGYEDIRVGEHTRIIKDCTLVPEDDGFTLYIGHAEADVVLYEVADDLTNEIDEGENLKLYQNSANEMRIPYVVLEIKNGTLTTDAIRSRTIIAREMNEIFPFIGYFFVGDEMTPTPRKIYRAGKHFDSFFVTGETGTRNWIEESIISDGIESHLSTLERLGVL